MKTVALILCFTIAGTLAGQLSDSAKEKLKEVHGKCQSNPSTHVDNDILKKLKDGEHVDLPDNFGAHMLCMSKGSGLQKEDGSLDRTVIREKVQEAAEDKSNVDSVVNDCAVEKDTPEKTAAHLFKCFHEKHVEFRHAHEEHDHSQHHH